LDCGIQNTKKEKPRVNGSEVKGERIKDKG
jgi:hypothetical protein